MRAPTLRLRRTQSILIVDDDPSTDLEELLPEGRFDVIRSYDVESAIAAAREHAAGRGVDVAIVDIALPMRQGQPVDRTGGLKALHELRAMSDVALIPLSGLGWQETNQSGRGILAQAAPLGIAGWLSKPVSRESVIAVIEHGLESRRPPALWGFWKNLDSTQYAAFATAVFLFVLCLWSVLSFGGMVSATFLPDPWTVMSRIAQMVSGGELFHDILASLARVLAGFGLASALAIPIGLLVGGFRVAEALLNPITAFFRYIPAVALVPLLILWFGIDDAQKVSVIFFGVFFYLVTLIAAVARSVPRELLETALTLGASTRQTFIRVLVPASLPGILENMRAMIGAAWTYVIVAELVHATNGLGHRIMVAQRVVRTDEVIAGILIIGVVGLITDYAFRLASRRLAPWT